MFPILLHSEYDFREGDHVTYDTEEGIVFARIDYAQDIAAFILVHFTNDEFDELELDKDGDIIFDALFDIGYDQLELLEER